MKAAARRVITGPNFTENSRILFPEIISADNKRQLQTRKSHAAGYNKAPKGELWNARWMSPSAMAHNDLVVPQKGQAYPLQARNVHSISGSLLRGTVWERTKAAQLNAIAQILLARQSKTKTLRDARLTSDRQATCCITSVLAPFPSKYIPVSDGEHACLDRQGQNHAHPAQYRSKASYDAGYG